MDFFEAITLLGFKDIPSSAADVRKQFRLTVRRLHPDTGLSPLGADIAQIKRARDFLISQLDKPMLVPRAEATLESSDDSQGYAIYRVSFSCPTCHGLVRHEQCPHCRGNGCPNCHGFGTVPIICQTCQNVGRVVQRIKMPRTVEDGQIVKIMDKEYQFIVQCTG